MTVEEATSGSKIETPRIYNSLRLKTVILEVCQSQVHDLSQIRMHKKNNKP